MSISTSKLCDQTIRQLPVHWTFQQKITTKRPTQPIHDIKNGVERVDARGYSPGRLASHIAKSLLKPKVKILVDNVRHMWFKGDLDNYAERYTRITALHHRTKGPFYSRRAGQLFRNMVRRMLPKNKNGTEALRRFKIGTEAKSSFRFDPVVRGFTFQSLICRLNGGLYLP